MTCDSTSLLTSKEAAGFLRISTRTLFDRTMPHGSIPCVRIGRSVRYSPAALRAWVDAEQARQSTIVTGKDA